MNTEDARHLIETGSFITIGEALGIGLLQAFKLERRDLIALTIISTTLKHPASDPYTITDVKAYYAKVVELAYHAADAQIERDGKTS